MRSYFYKINQKYIDNFFRNVKLSFKNNNIHTDSLFLKYILKNINMLFKFLGGRITNKNDIPKADDYPDSKKFNKLISDISLDVSKLFTSQKLVESDVNNLLNFNSSQRLKTYENLTSTQQQVYSLYIKNKKYSGRKLTIPSSNPFTSSDNISQESNGIYIDQNRGVLTLDSQSSFTKPINVNEVKIFFSNSIPTDSIYPNNILLGVGSHWEIVGRSKSHFISNNLTDLEAYKQMMIDTPNSNTGIGWCEFEAVRTDNVTKKNSPPIDYIIKNEIGKIFNKDAELIYFDIPNSLQGKYISNTNSDDLISPQYKLVIVFNQNAGITNELDLDFEPNDLGFYPKIVWDKSKIFSNQNGTDIAYSLVSPSDSHNITNNGEYTCLIQNGFIKPSRAEIVLEYGSDSLHWVPIGFKMSHYSYSNQQNYYLKDDLQSDILLILNKTYDIFVDSEADEENEKSRAINVLMARRK